MDLITIKNKLNKLTVERDNLKAVVESNSSKIDELNSELNIILDAQKFVQSVAKKTQDQLSIEIDDIVNLALQTIFPDEYTFHLDYAMSRGKTEARFNLMDSYGNPVDPMSSLGGGCVDVVCMALRIALYTLSSSDNVIVFDEPCRFLSANLRERMSDLIKVFSDKLNVQIIMVTHIQEFENNADVIKIRKENGKSKVCKPSA